MHRMLGKHWDSAEFCRLEETITGILLKNEVAHRMGQDAVSECL